MLYNEQTGAVEIELGELCAVAFGRKNYKDEAESLSEIADLEIDSNEKYNNVHLHNTCRIAGILVKTGATAEKVGFEDGQPTIDYQKKVAKLPESDQLISIPVRQRMLAYFLAAAKELNVIIVRHILVDSQGEIMIIPCKMTVQSLREEYGDLLGRALPYIEECVRMHKKVRPSSSDLAFPYPEIRPGQEDFMRECYRDILHGKRLFIQAPTGIGKTISTMYPAVRALGKGKCDKIFYLTAKASTRREALAAAKRLFEAGAHLRMIVLSAKEQMCPATNYSSLTCKHACPRSLSHTKIMQAISELLTCQNGYTPNLIRETAEKYGVCPYELSLDLSEFCNIIICDYNYVYNPAVKLRRYFEENNGKYVLLVDEAHNLTDRARDMYSATLESDRVLEISKMLPEHDPLQKKLCVSLGVLNRVRTYCKDSLFKDAQEVERGYYFSKQPLDELDSAMTDLEIAVEKWLKTHTYDALYEAIEAFYTDIRAFVATMQVYDSGFVTYLTVADRALTVQLLCLDPSNQLQNCNERAEAVIMFSATLTPPSYFAQTLGGGKDAVSVNFPSPFPHENLRVLVADGISTKYEEREKSYKKIASYIAASVCGKVGNYMVYFPSYTYMDKVYKIFKGKYPDVPTVVQSPNMTQAEKEAFLDSFREDSPTMQIGFCVLGGSFSEGVDLPGGRLIGSIIVGVGIPGLSDQRNIIRDHYEDKNGCGYDYAYVYPGMNRVLQAAGRVIRTDTDRGIVVLLDQRYAEQRYTELFPPHWDDVRYASDAQSLAKNVAEFWNMAK